MDNKSVGLILGLALLIYVSFSVGRIFETSSIDSQVSELSKINDSLEKEFELIKIRLEKKCSSPHLRSRSR